MRFHFMEVTERLFSLPFCFLSFYSLSILPSTPSHLVLNQNMSKNFKEEKKRNTRTFRLAVIVFLQSKLDRTRYIAKNFLSLVIFFCLSFFFLFVSKNEELERGGKSGERFESIPLTRRGEEERGGGGKETLVMRRDGKRRWKRRRIRQI